MNILLDSNITMAVGILELFLITNLVSWTVDIIARDFVDTGYMIFSGVHQNAPCNSKYFRNRNRFKLQFKRIMMLKSNDIY